MSETATRTFIIAEAGVNHNGSLDLALQLVDAAAAAGADAVKFQTFVAESLVTTLAPKARYQRDSVPVGDTQLEMLRALELDLPAHQALRARCMERGIEFCSTPFDHRSLHLLVDELDIPRVKIGSGDLTNAPLLLEIARAGKPILLSTGMASLGEVETALGVLAFGLLGAQGRPSHAAFQSAFSSAAGRARLRDMVTLLHCTSEYPAPAPEVNLRCMETMRQAFGLAVGYSDHTLGIAVPVAAVACGAAVIEKHLTLDKSLPGPDHRASLDPTEFGAMVAAIRQVEEALGDGVKTPATSELDNRVAARRSLVAARDIRAGQIISAADLAVKRPGGGISPLEYWDWLGRVASRDFQRDELIGP